MTESKREKAIKAIEILINEIDESLINIDKAKKESYIFYNFVTSIKSLLLLASHFELRQFDQKLNSYFSVFNNLNSFIAVDSVVLDSVNHNTNTFNYKRFREIDGLSEKIELEDYSRDAGEDIKEGRFSLGYSVPFKRKKIYIYLVGTVQFIPTAQIIIEQAANNEAERDPEGWFDKLFSNIMKLYVQYDYNILNIQLSLTFEQYVSELLTTSLRKKRTLTFEEIFVDTKDVAFVTKAMFDLKYTDKDGKSILGPKEKCIILAVVRILRLKEIIKDLYDRPLTDAFCIKLGLKPTRLEDDGKLHFGKAQKDILAYINKHR